MYHPFSLVLRSAFGVPCVVRFAFGIPFSVHAFALAFLRFAFSCCVPHPASPSSVLPHFAFGIWRSWFPSCFLLRSALRVPAFCVVRFLLRLTLRVHLFPICVSRLCVPGFCVFFVSCVFFRVLVWRLCAYRLRSRVVRFCAFRVLRFRALRSRVSIPTLCVLLVWSTPFRASRFAFPGSRGMCPLLSLRSASPRFAFWSCSVLRVALRALRLTFRVFPCFALPCFALRSLFALRAFRFAFPR